MSALFSAAGRRALQRLADMPSLLAFDLDGTLAPLVGRPEDAVVAPRTAARLRALARRWPVAVITGRQVDDALPRLGFDPCCLYGNHGAECAGTAPSERLQARLDGTRSLLYRERARLRLHLVEVEDKGLSLALHYRRSADPGAAAAWLDALAASLDGGVRSSHGHRVLNITPRDARDKGDGLLQMTRRCGAKRAMFVGDDVNDEPAFAKAPPGSVTVRIAPSAVKTQARFRLRGQQQIDRLLCLLLQLRR